MKAYRYAAYAACLMLLTGCKLLQLESPQDVADTIAYQQGNVKGLGQAARRALAEHRIASDEAEYVHDVASRSKTILDGATELLAVGDVAGATSRAEAAVIVLEGLKEWLDKRLKETAP